MMTGQESDFTGTADFIPFLRSKFIAGHYEGVIDDIDRFGQKATVYQSLARDRFTHFLKVFVKNYVVAAAIHQASISEWEQRFPDLLKELGLPKEDTWEGFIEEAVRKGKAAFAAAVETIRHTCVRFESEAGALTLARRWRHEHSPWLFSRRV